MATAEHYRVLFQRNDLGFIPTDYLANVIVLGDLTRTVIRQGFTKGRVLHEPIPYSLVDYVGSAMVPDDKVSFLERIGGEIVLSVDFLGNTREIIDVLTEPQPWYLKPIR